jgi:soluble lytic murein transglycosylase
MLFLAVGVTVGLLGSLCVPTHLAPAERLDPLASAAHMISEGDYARALKLLRELPGERLDQWEMDRVRLQKGLCYRALGRYDEAVAAFDGGPGGFESLASYVDYWKADALEKAGSPELAHALFDEASAGSRGWLRDAATLRLARSYERGREFAKAVQAYERLIGGSLEERAALAGLANVLERQQDTARTREIRLQLIEDYGWSSEALGALRSMETFSTDRERFHAGVAYARHGKYRTATRLLRNVVQDSDDPIWQGRAQYELARVYYRKRDYRTASRAFDVAYRTHRVPKGLLERARCLVRMGDDLEGARQFELFASTFPTISGAAEGLWQAAMAYERKRHYKNARRVFIGLAGRYSKSDYAGQALWRAGYIQYKRGDYEASARDFLRLANRTDENYLKDQGHYWAAKCYTELKRDDEALYWMERAAEGFPTSYYSSRARAVLGLTTPAYPPAPDVEREGTPYEPSEEMVRGDLLASLGLFREAEREYRQTESDYIANRYALNDLLHRYERIGSMDRALRVSNYLLNAERSSGVPVTMTVFRRLYPTYYWGAVNRTADEVDVDPNLILAIMRQESAFNEHARSSAGARGLMQVMPATGRQMARKIRDRDFTVEDLWKPNTSIRLGGEHLSDHLQFFKKQEDVRRLGLALSAYNAGLGRARRWSERLPSDDVDSFVESIPFLETRNYVKLVYRNYQVYTYLQNESDGLLAMPAVN